ncbi:Ankyrin repeat family protein [Prunus dulcis]|uniref:Ankyrin repeat family protein n=1 Tax=Prunus dulcis TaxID=3755 RepID=A0A4Y1QM50_PRUDU|nr:Ankyrin repeat family protein [Prunus dulcis]
MATNQFVCQSTKDKQRKQPIKQPPTTINNPKLNMAATVSPIANLKLLNHRNYEDWSFRVKVYLLAEDVWDLVEATTEPPKPEDGEVAFKAWRKNNAKALLAIQTSCGDDTYPIIEGITEAKAAWDALAEELKPSDSDEELKPSDSEEETGHNNDADESDVNYAPLYDSLKRGDWNAAKEFIDRHEEALTHRGSSSGGTALHEAIERKQLHIVEELLKLMTEEDLEIQDDNGCTAFFYALQKGMAPIVAKMVKKKKKLVTMRFTNVAGNRTPVLVAYILGHWEIARFLYSRTPIRVLTRENSGRDGAQLISNCLFHTNKFDIGWDLLQKCPKLALTETYVPDSSPLYALAGSRFAFLSGVPLRFWQRWIYNNIHVQQPQPAPINSDVCVNFEELEDDKRNPRDLISSGIHDLHEMRLGHDRILQILPLMCGVATRRNLDSKQTAFVKKAIFRAVERGQVEFIKEMCKANPRIPLITGDESGRTIFHYAVACRQEKVFSLIYGLSEYDRNHILKRSDKFNNTILHAAGSLSAHLNHIQGAALQMQRELQWFKEVERILQPQQSEVRNKTEKITARELFTKNHKKLVKEGEESMKGTATSCTVVGALIVTIMFAAAFTVPGGNNQDTDSISLFSSTTSVMIFLGILTSRYAEDDFLRLD